jgi:hypothetical protein
MGNAEAAAVKIARHAIDRPQEYTHRRRLRQGRDTLIRPVIDA